MKPTIAARPCVASPVGRVEAQARRSRATSRMLKDFIATPWVEDSRGD